MLTNSPSTGDRELDAYLYSIRNTLEDILYFENKRKEESFSGTFLTGDGRTATVVQGIIVSVV